MSVVSMRPRDCRGQVLHVTSLSFFYWLRLITPVAYSMCLSTIMDIIQTITTMTT